MKKIVTLLMAVMAITGAGAQSQTTEEARRILMGDRQDNRSYPSDDRRVYDERDGRYGSVDEINRDYDAKIRSIRNNRNLSNAEKERIIRDLERQRQRRIDNVRGNNDRRYERDRRYEDDDDRYGKKYKHGKQKGNNGKHKGWEKGKGNPHRYD